MAESGTKLPNVQEYVKNLTTSVLYAADDVVGKLVPTYADFKDTNKEVFTEAYSAIRNYRMTFRRIGQAVKTSRVYEATDTAFKNAMDDLRTGKFYNKERTGNFENQLISAGDDFGLSEDSMDELDKILNDDFGEDEENLTGITKGDAIVAKAVSGSAAESTSKIASATVKAAQLTAKANQINTNIMYAQNEKIMHTIQAGFTSASETMARMVEFANGPMTTHIENATTFYKTATDTWKETNAMIKEMLEMQRNQYKALQHEEKQKTPKARFGDISTANGVVDLKEYFTQIGKNAQSYVDEKGMGMASMLFSKDSILGDNPLLAFAQNPLGGIMTFMVATAMGPALQKSAKKLNETVSGIFGTVVNKLNGMAKDEDNPLAEAIGKIFGIKDTVTSSFDTSKYNKGPMQWDGEAKQALTKVIPQLLSMIHSDLSGEPQKVYDYKTGKFTTYNQLKQQFKAVKTRHVDSATRDIQDELYDNTIRRGFKMRTRKEQEVFAKDIERFLEKMYNEAGFDSKFINRKREDANKDGLFSSDENAELIWRAMSNPNNKRMQRALMQFGSNRLNERTAHDKEMQNYQETSDALLSLFDNSNIQKINEKTGEISKLERGRYGSYKGLLDNRIDVIKDDKGNTLFYYLQNMYKELQYARVYGLGIGGTPDPMFGNSLVLGGANNAPKYMNRRARREFDERYGRDVSDKRVNSMHIDEREPDTFRHRYRQSEINADNRWTEDYQKEWEKQKRAKQMGKEEDSDSLVVDPNLNEADYQAELYKRVGIRALENNDRDARKRARGTWLNDEYYDNRTKWLQDHQDLVNDITQKGSLEAIRNAETLADKFNVIRYNLEELGQKPSQFLTKMVENVDQQLYDFFYKGEPAKDERTGKTATGFFGRMKIELSNTFYHVNDWLDENILDPLKEKFGISTFGEGFDKLTEWAFGTKASDMWAGAKEKVGDFFAPVRDSIKSTFTDFFADAREQLEEAAKKAKQAMEGKTDEDVAREEEKKKKQERAANINPALKARLEALKAGKYQFDQIPSGYSDFVRNTEGGTGPRTSRARERIEILNMNGGRDERMAELNAQHEKFDKTKDIYEELTQLDSETYLDSVKKARKAKLQEELSGMKLNNTYYKKEYFVNLKNKLSGLRRIDDKKIKELEDRIKYLKEHISHYNVLLSGPFALMSQRTDIINAMNNAQNELNTIETEYKNSIGKDEAAKLDKLIEDGLKDDTKDSSTPDTRTVNQRLIDLNFANGRGISRDKFNVLNEATKGFTDLQFTGKSENQKVGLSQMLGDFMNSDEGREIIWLSSEDTFRKFFKDTLGIKDKTLLKDLMSASKTQFEKKRDLNKLDLRFVYNALLKYQKGYYKDDEEKSAIIDEAKQKLRVGDRTTSLVDMVGKNKKLADLEGISSDLAEEIAYRRQYDEQKKLADLVNSGNSGNGENGNNNGEDINGNIVTGNTLLTEIKDSINTNMNNLIGKIDSLTSAILGMNIGAHSEGSRMVEKSGITAISKGEMIIPADENPLNPDKDKVDIKQQARQEEGIRRSFIESLVKAIPLNANADNAKDAGEVAANKAKEEAEAKVKEVGNRVGDTALEKIASGADTLKTGVNRAASGTSEFFSRVFGLDNQKVKDATNQTMETVKQNSPDMIAKGLLGGTLGLVIGAPFVGAMLGGAVSLVQNNETFMESLFGKKVVDKEGNESREGGFISKDLQDSIQKYLPDLKAFGVAGGLAGLILPFGPLGGAMIGSALAIAKNNKTISETLFGDQDGLIDAKAKQFIHNALPNMAVGAVGGMLLGPFGLFGNMILGSAAGMVTSTDTFQTLLFGRKDEESGQRIGGIAGAIKEEFVDPLANVGKEIAGGFKDFLQNKVFAPIKEAFQPLAKQMEIITVTGFKTITNFVKGWFKTRIGRPLYKTIQDYVFHPIRKAFGGLYDKLLKPIMTPVKAVLGAPFSALRGVGNKLKKRQIRKGQADYLVSGQRLNFMGDEDYEMKRFDTVLSNLSSTQGGIDNLKQMKSQLKFMNRGDQALQDEIDASQRGIWNKLENTMGKGKFKALTTNPGFQRDIIAKYFKQGKYDKAIKEIEASPMDQETKARLLEWVKEAQDRLQRAKEAQAMYNQDKDKMAQTLQDTLGIDVKDKDQLENAIGLIDKEISFGSKRLEDVKNNVVSGTGQGAVEGVTKSAVFTVNGVQKSGQEIVDTLKEGFDRLQKTLEAAKAGNFDEATQARIDANNQKVSDALDRTKEQTGQYREKIDKGLQEGGYGNTYSQSTVDTLANSEAGREQADKIIYLAKKNVVFEDLDNLIKYSPKVMARVIELGAYGCVTKNYSKVEKMSDKEFLAIKSALKLGIDVKTLDDWDKMSEDQLQMIIDLRNKLVDENGNDFNSKISNRDILRWIKDGHYDMIAANPNAAMSGILQHYGANSLDDIRDTGENTVEDISRVNKDLNGAPPVPTKKEKVVAKAKELKDSAINSVKNALPDALGNLVEAHAGGLVKAASNMLSAVSKGEEIVEAKTAAEEVAEKHKATVISAEEVEKRRARKNAAAESAKSLGSLKATGTDDKAVTDNTEFGAVRREKDAQGNYTVVNDKASKAAMAKVNNKYNAIMEIAENTKSIYDIAKERWGMDKEEKKKPKSILDSILDAITGLVPFISGLLPGIVSALAAIPGKIIAGIKSIFGVGGGDGAAKAGAEAAEKAGTEAAEKAGVKEAAKAAGKKDLAEAAAKAGANGGKKTLLERATAALGEAGAKEGAVGTAARVGAVGAAGAGWVGSRLGKVAGAADEAMAKKFGLAYKAPAGVAKFGVGTLGMAAEGFGDIASAVKAGANATQTTTSAAEWLNKEGAKTDRWNAVTESRSKKLGMSKAEEAYKAGDYLKYGKEVGKEGVTAAADAITKPIGKVFGKLAEIAGTIVGKIPGAKPAEFSKALTKLGEALVENLAKKGASKIVVKAGAKFIPVLGEVYMAADCAASFYDGINNPGEVLGINKPSDEIPIGHKLLAGITKAVVDTCTFGLVPASFVAGLVADFIAPALGVEDISQARDQSQAELDKYNAENGTNLTMEEYIKQSGNHNNTIGETISEGWDSFKKGVVNNAEYVANGIKNNAEYVWNGVKNNAEYVKNGIQNNYEYVKNTVSQKLDDISAGIDIGKQLLPFIEAEVSRAGSYLTGSDKSFDELDASVQIDDNDPLKMYKQQVHQIVSNWAIPIAVVGAVYNTMKSVFETASNAISDTGSKMNSVYAAFEPAMQSGDLNSFANTKITDATGGFQDVPSAIATVGGALYTLPALGVTVYNAASKKIGDFITSLTEGGNSVGSKMQSVYAAFEPAMQSGDLNGILNTRISDITGGFTDLSSGIATIGGGLYSIPAMAVTVYNGASKKVGEVIDSVAQSASEAGSGISQAITTLGTYVYEGNIESFFSAPQYDDSFGGTVATATYRAGQALLFPAVGITAGIRTIKEGFENIISYASEGISQTYDKSAIENYSGDLGSADYWRSSIQSDNPFSAIPRIEEFVYKILYAPVKLMGKVLDKIKESAIFKAGSEALNWLTSKAKELKENVSNTNKKGKGSGRYGRGDDTESGINFSQMNPDIKDIRYNIPGDTEYQTVGDSACGPLATASAIMAAKSGRGAEDNSVNPLKMVGEGLNFKGNNDGVSGDFISYEANKHGLKAEKNTDKGKIEDNIDKNIPTVVQGVDKNMGDDNPFGDPHYVTVLGTDGRGNVKVANPEEPDGVITKYNKSKFMNHVQYGYSMENNKTVGRGARIAAKHKSLYSRGRGTGSKKVFKPWKYGGGHSKKYGKGDLGGTIWDYLKGKGLSNIVCAGILGNFRAESGVMPDRVQGSGVQTAPEITVDGVTGYGLAQWTYSSRQQALKDYAASQGKSSSDWQVQCDFMLSGQDGDVSGLFQSMDASGDPGQSALIFHDDYERSADDAEKKQRRADYAKEYFEKNGHGVVDSSSFDGGKSNGSSNGGAVNGAVQQASNPLEAMMSKIMGTVDKKVTSAFQQSEIGKAGVKMFGANFWQSSSGGNVSGGSNGGPASMSTNPNIKKASEYANSRVGGEGFGNTGCTTWANEYLHEAGYPDEGHASSEGQGYPYGTIDLDNFVVAQRAKESSYPARYKDPSEGAVEGDLVQIHTSDRYNGEWSGYGIDTPAPTHIVVADGQGGYWGNSSSSGLIKHGDMSDWAGEITNYIATGGDNGQQGQVTTGHTSMSMEELAKETGGGSGRYGRGKSKYGRGFFDSIKDLFKSKKKEDTTANVDNSEDTNTVVNTPNGMTEDDKIPDYNKIDYQNDDLTVIKAKLKAQRQDAKKLHIGAFDPKEATKDTSIASFEPVKVGDENQYGIPEYNLIKDTDSLLVRKAKIEAQRKFIKNHFGQGSARGLDRRGYRHYRTVYNTDNKHGRGMSHGLNADFAKSIHTAFVPEGVEYSNIRPDRHKKDGRGSDISVFKPVSAGDEIPEYVKDFNVIQPDDDLTVTNAKIAAQQKSYMEWKKSHPEETSTFEQTVSTDVNNEATNDTENIEETSTTEESKEDNGKMFSSEEVVKLLTNISNNTGILAAILQLLQGNNQAASNTQSNSNASNQDNKEERVMNTATGNSVLGNSNLKQFDDANTAQLVGILRSLASR